MYRSVLWCPMFGVVRPPSGSCPGLLDGPAQWSGAAGRSSLQTEQECRPTCHKAKKEARAIIDTGVYVCTHAAIRLRPQGRPQESQGHGTTLLINT